MQEKFHERHLQNILKKDEQLYFTRVGATCGRTERFYKGKWKLEKLQTRG